VNEKETLHTRREEKKKRRYGVSGRKQPSPAWKKQKKIKSHAEKHKIGGLEQGGGWKGPVPGGDSGQRERFPEKGKGETEEKNKV